MNNLETLKKTIKDSLTSGDRLLIGFSGGGDSTVLMHLLHRLQPELELDLRAVHVNHSLRGAESDADAEYTRQFANQLGIPIIIKQVDVKAYLRKHGGNKQQAARILRYDAFAEVAKIYGFTKLVLAHHADDQVETIFLHILRGTGLSGLQGMTFRSKHGELEVLRPLLTTEYQMLTEYIRNYSLQPRLDSSNLSIDYTRNRVRHELLPQLLTFNPNLKQRLIELATISSAEEAEWDESLSKKWSEAICIEECDEIELELSVFRKYSVAVQRRLLRKALYYLSEYKPLEITFANIESVRRLVDSRQPASQLSLTGFWKVFRKYDKLSILWIDINNSELISLGHSPYGRAQDPDIQRMQSIELLIPGISLLPGFMGSIETFITKSADKPVLEYDDVVWFDRSKLGRDLVVRARKIGDRIHCLGMQRDKKVKNVFIDGKVPRFQRMNYPLICDGDEIIWIPGLRRSNKALIDKSTTEYLYLFWRKPREDFVNEK